MKPFQRSVIELFDGKKRYLIPLYQRQYVWRFDRQLARFWEDLKTKAEQHLKNETTVPHFLGAIVISHIPTFGRQVPAYDVIDGQQRLTTFQVLLGAFRDVAQISKSEFAAELQKHIVNDGIMEDKAVERYKVWPSQVDRPQMRALVDSGSRKNVDALEKSELGKATTGVEPIMLRAYTYFYDQIYDFINAKYLDSTKDDRIEALFHALKYGLGLVAIELEGGDDPQVIFETLNGLNEPLLPSDLMRNFIFQRAYHEKRTSDEKTPDDLYNEYWLPFDRHFWKREEKQGRLKRPRVDIFFQHFLAMKKATDINVGRLYHEYRVWINDTKPYAKVESELIDASHYAAIYKKLLTPEEPSDLSSFAEMLNVLDVKTITPLILFLCGETQLTGDSLTQALAMLESYLVRRAVCGFTTKNYNRYFLQLVETLRGKTQTVAALIEALAKSDASNDATYWPNDTAFRQAWMGQPLYNQLASQRLQYILKKIEDALRNAKNEKIEIKSTLTIEHVMPVEWCEFWPLPDGRIAKSSLERILDPNPDELSDNRDRVIHTIGNLTLLTQPLNSSVQNRSYAEKRPEILKQSALALNREFQSYETWDEKSISARSRKLFDHALHLWPYVARA